MQLQMMIGSSRVNRVMRTIGAMAGALVLVMIGSRPAVSLPATEPEQVGLSSERLERIDEAFRQAVEDGELPGAVVLVARRGQIAYFESFGFRDATTGEPMPRDAIFRIYSMTKPLVSVAAMILVEEGALQLADPVSIFLPEFRDLRVSVPSTDDAGRTIYETRGTTPDEQIERLAEIALIHEPGTFWEYGLESDLLGRVVERVSGMELGAFMEERLFRPLGMVDTGFHVPQPELPRLAAPFAANPTTGEPIELLDVSAPPANASGGAGAVSTAGD